MNEKAGPAIEAFCYKLNIPLVTSYKGKGLIDENNPLCLGGAGLSPKADTIIMPALESADAIILLGYDPIEMRIGWRNPWGPEKTVIEITPIARTHGMHAVSHSLHGSLEPTLTQLSRCIKASRKSISEPMVNARDAFLRQMFKVNSEFGPDRVFETLRHTLPQTAVATVDSGAHRILLNQMRQCSAPRGLLQSSALCTDCNRL